jgi:hypothetical protein
MALGVHLALSRFGQSFRAGLVFRRFEDSRLNSPHQAALQGDGGVKNRAGETVPIGKAARFGAEYRYFGHERKSPLALPRL